MTQSSNAYSGQNLADWSDARLLDALTELANVRDDAGALRFLQRCPDFLEIKDRGWLLELGRFAPGFSETPTAVEPSPIADEAMLSYAQDVERVARQMTPTRTTNPADAAQRHHVKLLSKSVQEIWRGLPEGARHLLVFFVIDDLTDALQVAIASNQVQRDSATEMRHILQHLGLVPAKLLQERLRPDWTRVGRFSYQPATLFQKALYLLWSKSSLTKVCKNPDCGAPFFIARRIQQQYCSDRCATPFRLEAKLKWWNKAGKERREKQISKRKTKQRRA